ncbi:hypothetical protein DY000_02003916 [Brassica cretica]|uniref:Uncharacterized protein n=1 Tax=Brassica cretica TaxID=69181 RepID=A0ABQ7C9T3_BRACR|nr:hypothetical protein DY000_02003916 [Brassica cretica]
MRLLLHFTKFGAGLKTLKRSGTNAANSEYSLGLYFTIMSFGIDSGGCFYDSIILGQYRDFPKEEGPRCAKSPKSTIVASWFFRDETETTVEHELDHNDNGGC